MVCTAVGRPDLGPTTQETSLSSCGYDVGSLHYHYLEGGILRLSNDQKVVISTTREPTRRCQLHAAGTNP